MLQLPLLAKVKLPPLVMVHTPVVADVKLTGRPALLVAVTVGAVPKVCVPGLPKAMVWVPFGVTADEAAEATLVPVALVAVTVKA
jgi:hypothetical protein